MTTIATSSCPRCDTRLYDASDHYGPCLMCIRCGFMADLDYSGMLHDDIQHIPYIGLNSEWKGWTIGYHEVWNRRKTGAAFVAERIILCPMQQNQKPCAASMRPTGMPIKTPTKATQFDNAGNNRILNEYRCHRGHQVGLTQNWTGWG